MSSFQRPDRGKRGFQRASGLLQSRIRKVGEGRGFEVSRLLTHWAEVAGDELARMTKPVNVSYGRGNFGATLTLLCTGANAPVVQMQTETLKERVNACYGYAAIRHIRITQTAPSGFADGKVAFAPAPAPDRRPSAAAKTQSETMTADVADTDLRHALAALGANILTKTKPN